MNFSLYLGHTFLQRTLHSMQFTHLFVRVKLKQLVVYSIEDGKEAPRAIFTQLDRHEYTLKIVGPKGTHQLTPFVGTLAELIPILTTKLHFVLVRWIEH
ncbi:hypothetical protein [Cohnella thailandensis]|uniref:Uncharacterized protein n=1 Tax=Cohnella thailandensis TaxID=557557 RepID=A0A841SY86_9BACL|nr:hypothetical protein [Cohnella thailandensis]MBB6635185.1 hypothetical protein [Cohnella thailandensis]MBP1974349.1 hypothetical protein [Cohnella thailandensis]